MIRFILLIIILVAGFSMFAGLLGGLGKQLQAQRNTTNNIINQIN